MEYLKKNWKTLLVVAAIIAIVIWFLLEQKKKRYASAQKEAWTNATEYLTGKILADANGINVTIQMMQNIINDPNISASKKAEAADLIKKLTELKAKA